jgi:hypothetical protein
MSEQEAQGFEYAIERSVDDAMQLGDGAPEEPQAYEAEGGYEDEGYEDPDPSFDVEADREAGIDVEHPLYKRMLAMQQASAVAPQNQSMEALKADLAARQILEGQNGAEQSFEYSVSWDEFNPTPIPMDDPLAEHADTINRIVRDHVGYVMRQVNMQSAQQVERVKAGETNRYLSEVIDAIGNEAGPQAKASALSLLAEHKDIAKRSPEAWAKFVVNSLGVQPKASSTAPARRPGAPDARQLAQSVRGASQRPRPQGAARREPPKKYDKTADAVAAALDAQLGRRR